MGDSHLTDTGTPVFSGAYQLTRVMDPVHGFVRSGFFDRGLWFERSMGRKSYAVVLDLLLVHPPWALDKGKCESASELVVGGRILKNRKGRWPFISKAAPCFDVRERPIGDRQINPLMDGRVQHGAETQNLEQVFLPAWFVRPPRPGSLRDAVGRDTNTSKQCPEISPNDGVWPPLRSSLV